ncbi:unnamed protein product, partial [Porites evermanni]
NRYRTETVDLSRFPSLTFTDVEKYAASSTGCESTAKAYKFFAEPGYLHDIKILQVQNHLFLFLVVTYGATEAVVFARCHRSMKKSEPAHSLQLIIITENKKVSGKCSCVAGAGGFCHHFIGLLFYLAHLKQLGFKSVPDDLTCTMVAQRWSVPRARQIEPQCVDSVLVKKPQEGANYN